MSIALDASINALAETSESITVASIVSIENIEREWPEYQELEPNHFFVDIGGRSQGGHKTSTKKKKRFHFLDVRA